MKKTIYYILLKPNNAPVLNQLKAEKAELYDLLGKEVGGGTVETATISGLPSTYVLMYSDDLDTEPEFNAAASKIANRDKYNAQILLKVFEEYYNDDFNFKYWEEIDSLTEDNIKMLEEKYGITFER